MIKHTFVVMAYKDSPYLKNCLDSLKNQTVKSEICIATSTPSSYISQIAKNYEIEIFSTEPNQGIAHDWNFGIKHAKTKYVTLAHQDDLYASNYTELCVLASEKFKDTQICFTNYSEIINNIERKNTIMLMVKKIMLFILMPLKKNIRSPFWKKMSQAFGTPIPCPSVMFNKETLRDFHFSNEFKISLDWDAWLRMAKMKGRFVYVPHSLLKHRIHIDSATSEGIKNNDRQKEDMQIYRRVWPGFIAIILLRLYSTSYKSNKVYKT